MTTGLRNGNSNNSHPGKEAPVRKLPIILIAAAGLAVAASLPAHAATSGLTAQNPQYVCDGNGQGSCMSLVPGIQFINGDTYDLYAFGEAAGAWRWDVYQQGGVDPSNPVPGGVDGEAIVAFGLFAENDSYCAGNSGGSVYAKPSCDPQTTIVPASDQWVVDANNGYLINVGRSRDQGTEEILCNPGGGDQLSVVPPGSCTAYHRDWGSS
jgi:hypothetical protein